MNSLRILLFLLAGFPFLYAEETPDGPAGEVKAERFDWIDAKRDRSVPVKIYFPVDSKALPVILFSHGLGSSREGYSYLGKYWAEHGFISVHMQHVGSDESVWKGTPLLKLKGALRQAANAENTFHRAEDIHFVLDQLEKLNRSPGELQGRLDLQRVGLAGHSFGALTTLTGIGLKLGPNAKSSGDARIIAAVAMSSPVTRFASGYDAIKVPCFHMTGTNDSSPIGETKAGERRIPYDKMNGAPQFLLIFEGGDHMIFSGRGKVNERPDDPRFQKLICETSLAFWKAYLKNDSQAKAWLTDGAARDELGNSGKLEMKKIR